MSTQPEALQILQHMADEWQEDWDGKRIRNELRRLHEVNQELLEALKSAMSDLSMYSQTDNAVFYDEALSVMTAAIAKAQGESK